MMENQEKYIRFCEKETEVPVFHRPEWLDAVCGNRNSWDVVLLEKNGEVIASLPLFYKKKKIIGQPPLTPYLGPYIKFPEGQKSVTKYRYERNVLEALIGKIPDFKYLKMLFLPEIKNWLPFYWNGFNETTRYTFILDNLNKHLNLNEMKPSIRRQIKKASKNIQIEFSDNIESFYNINKLSFERQKMNIPYSLTFLKRLDQVVKDHRTILFGKDNKENIHAAIYILWDNKRAYYLMGGLNADFQNSGAKPLLFWEAMKYVSSFVLEFDFEGSMIRSIENFFSSFGAKQVPYHLIYKDNRSNAVRLISNLKSRL
jgi:hypothetical protein